MSNMNRQDRALKDTSSPANDSPLTTQAKALALNLDPATLGGFTEIGGGQEVARCDTTTFFAFAERGLPGHHGADRKDPGASGSPLSSPASNWLHVGRSVWCLAAVILEHAQLLLFAWVFGNQAGVPITVVPILVGAGALAGSGQGLSMAVIIVTTVGASLGADLTWSVLGRWRGLQLLRMFDENSPWAGTLARRVRQAFLTHVGAFQVSARFLPELNPIAAGVAGATGSSLSRFLGRGTISALTWAAAWIGCGYFLSDAIVETSSRLGAYLIVLLIAPFALYVLLHGVRHQSGSVRQRGTTRSDRGTALREATIGVVGTRR